MLFNPKGYGFVIAGNFYPPRPYFNYSLVYLPQQPVIFYCSRNEPRCRKWDNSYELLWKCNKCNPCFSYSSSCWHTSSCWLGLELLVLPPSQSLYTLTSGTFARMLLFLREPHFAWTHASTVRLIFINWCPIVCIDLDGVIYLSMT